MADRVHPGDSPPVSAEVPLPSSQDDAATLTAATKPHPPPQEKPVPPPGTYVIKIPKDQIYRVPPPENARRYEQYTRRNHGRNRCCRCCCWIIGVLFILVVLLGITAGVLYLVFRPKAPHYSIDQIVIKGMNLTKSSAPPSTAPISPAFDVTVRADNPNDKIGIRYERDSSAEMYFNGVRLCNGALPSFYQPPNNVTVFMTALRGNGIELKRSDEAALVKAQTERQVPLTVKLVAPVKITVGSVKTWKITVKVNCDVTVDQLTAKAKIVSKQCDYKVKLW